MGQYTKPTNKIVVYGDPGFEELQIETVANIYPGRLIKRGTADFQCVVCGEFENPVGWAGYEKAHADFKPASVDTIYEVSDWIPALHGPGIVLVASTIESAVTKGDWLSSAAGGKLKKSYGVVQMRYAFSQNASATKLCDIPADAIIQDVEVEVVTAVAASTIDIGDEDDTDGYVDGLSCATAGHIALAGSDANTVGELLEGAEQSGSNRKMNIGYPATKELQYLTSAHAIAGFVIVTMLLAGGKAADSVARAVETVSSAGDIMVASAI